MKNQILEIIENHPRSYIHQIKKDEKLLDWIKSNSTADTDHFPSRVYSAISGESDICKYGNKKKFTRISTGFSCCGPANKCKCTQESISDSVSKTKSQYTESKKERINQQRRKTMKSRYGVEYNSQRKDIKHIWSKPKIPQEIFDKLDDKDWLKAQYITNNRTAVDIANDLDVYYSTVIEYCKKHGFKIKQRSQYSQTEKQVADFIQDLGFATESNTRSILHPKEIDIYIPAKKLGIEINGLYWHSYDFKSNDREDRFKHLEKTKQAEKQGVELLHITDWEWANKSKIVKSIIKSKLGINKRIYARQTVCKKVESKTARNFLDQNHIQGKCPSTVYFGLYHNNNLVMIASAGKNRFNKSQIELHRLATLINYTVVGGASKLLKQIEQHFNTDRIVSYCDRDKSNGKMYKSTGFDFVRETGPGYFWTDGNSVYSRYRCQKKNLANWLPSFDASLSEAENLFRAGYRRYWTCGNLVFEKKKC